MGIESTTALIGSLLPGLRQDELADLLRMVEGGAFGWTDGGDYIALLRRPDRSSAFKTAAGFVHARRRAAGVAVNTEERASALRALGELRELITRRLTEAGDAQLRNPLPPKPEAARAARASVTTDTGRSLLPNLQDGAFVQLAYETVLQRGCAPEELRDGQLKLEGGTSRRDLLAQLFAASVAAAAAEQRHEATHDGLYFHVMGTGERVTLADWQAKAKALAEGQAGEPADTSAWSRYKITRAPRRLISAIASMYRGGRFIERFLQNITGQTCFRDYCELIIVDANSPEGEYEVIKPYLARFENIRYVRINHRIGVYDAWNIGVEAAKGDYLTNTNVDDLRSAESLELQAGVLDNLPFADVVYQDFYYTFDPTLSFEEVARFGYRSRLPLVTPYTLMAYNPPHNAPMWRRRLHDELGLFDTSYQSAGDYEFWMRCLAAGKTFFKMNEPHVVYYQNPNGLSTRPGTRGFAETKAIHRKYDRLLTSENLVTPFDRFCAEQLPGLPVHLDGGRQDRYLHAHRALRQLARSGKYHSPLEQAA
jgi:glycosyltransferase involved in cell wall biosynthesis